jgi:hypothetical protein
MVYEMIFHDVGQIMSITVNHLGDLSDGHSCEGKSTLIPCVTETSEVHRHRSNPEIQNLLAISKIWYSFNEQIHMHRAITGLQVTRRNRTR